jgi:DNA-binding GntR family transcriptional regulator
MIKKLLKNIERSDTVTEKVLQALRSAIVQGAVKPGERLNESATSLQLGISRAPIREALKILEAEGLVETIPRRGSFVTNVSIKEIEETFVVVKIINIAAAGLAAAHMTEPHRKELKSIMRQMGRIKGSDDMEKVKNRCGRLHNFIIMASENRHLMKIQKSLELHEERFRAAGTGYGEGDIAEIVDEHLVLSEALLKGDADQAEFLMAQHVEKGRLRVLKALKRRSAGSTGESSGEQVGSEKL